MKFYGDAHLQQNKLREAAIPLDTFFPATPVVGQIVFKDRILYICVEISSGVPIWVPLTNEITSYTHIQNTDSAIWTVNHPLNTAHVNVTVYDSQNRVIIPNEISVTSASTVVITFTEVKSGEAMIMV